MQPAVGDRARSGLRGLLALTGLALLTACGQGEAPGLELPPPPGPEPESIFAPTPIDRNQPPLVRSVRIEPEDPQAGEVLRAVVEATDPDADSIRLRFSWTLDGEPVGGGTSKLVLRDAVRGQVVEVTVVASDGHAETRPVRERVRLQNRPPRVEGLEVQSAQVRGGTELVAVPRGRDEDGDSLEFRYEWTLNGNRLAEEGPRLGARRLQRDDVVTVTVVASDGRDDSEPLSSPDVRIVNNPPRVVSSPSRTSADGVFHYELQVEDPDGDRDLRFALESAPAGMTIDPLSGSITWKPTSRQAGHHPVRVVVDDLHGGKVAYDFDVQVGEEAPPAAPASR